MSNTASPIMRLIHELRRRRVFRTAALYIVGTWLVLQVADVTFPALEISERAIRYLLTGAVLGFPVALVFGWFYDISAYGIQRTAPAEPGELVQSIPLRRFDYILLTTLAIVVSAIIYNVTGKVVEEPTQVNDVTRKGPPMVAVLPFTAVSKDGENEFFATGIHDDLLTQLAQLQSIRVISRTSVMEYKDTIRNIKEIGQILGADAILEGGIQSAGNRIRINAQLIDAKTDEHLWAQTFDRELSATSIFDVQTEIAREITSAMHATLTEQDANSLDIIPTNNMAAYRGYRKAMEMAKTQSIYENSEYREILEDVVKQDPGFTRAWMELGGHLSYINFWGQPNPDDIERAEEILEILRKLAPNSVDHLLAQAYYSFYTLKDYAQAFEIISLAEEKAPSDLKILEMKSWVLRRLGRQEERTVVFKKMLELDPKSERTSWALIWNLMLTHNYTQAWQELENTKFDFYHLTYLKSLLGLWENRDYEQYSMRRISDEKEFGPESDTENLWMAYIGARDFESARSLLENVNPHENTSRPELGQRRITKIITYWFLKDDSNLREAVTDARKHLEKSGDQEDVPDRWRQYMDLAIITAVEGKTEETTKLIRRWQRAAIVDPASRIFAWHLSCQILGVSGAISETVDCIRTGLVEPSSVFPFLEPYLPYYDSIRDEPEFIELVTEIASSIVLSDS